MKTRWSPDDLLIYIPPDDPDAAPLLAFLRRRRVRVGSRRMARHIGAFWLPGGWIVLNTRYWQPGQPVTPELTGLFLHEVCHLRQGVTTALSVYGELEAWQLGFRYTYRHTGGTPPPVLRDLLALPLARDREVLREARRLMQVYASEAYRADLLPLFPWGDELRWRLGWRKRTLVE